jgi:NAD dependent epimerase/dehydratase
LTKSFSGKKVFVTGADGFIGSHLVELLVNLGADVKALVYYNSWNYKGWLSDLSSQTISQINIVKGDIRDGEHIRELVKGCDYVMHLSSLIAIPYSYDAPRSYIDTNVTGALNVLQACRESDSLIRMVHVSTSETYGSAQHIPIDESHPLVGQSPYSASKIAADKLAESYNLSFDLPVVIARPFNTFGPRQTARAIIPTIASQLISGKDELHLGLLSPSRDFNYVTDTANGMINLALCDKADGLAVNIGSGEEWSIAETAKILCNISGRDVSIITDEKRIRPAKSEVDRLLADNSKITELTDWSSKISFYDGLVSTYKWIEKNIKMFDVDHYAK